VNPDAEAELRRVYRAHVRRVFAFFAYTVDAATAEDLTSQTFERVIGSWARFDPRQSSERTWILSIARNALIDHIRRDRRRQTVSLDGDPVIAEMLAAPGGLSSVFDRQAFVGWLGNLGERERTVLAMRYAGDLTPAEIAQALDLSVGNVHQIISRSLRRLRELSVDRQPPDRS
jgi:RNA polymerase sigma factor (sigma-70 family)